MLDKLSDLSPQVLGKLRHMRYSCEHPLSLQFFADDRQYRKYGYRLPEVLKLLRGLHLDSLTVVGRSRARDRYRELDALINHSDGWKELYYLSNDSVMLGFGKFGILAGNTTRDRDLRAPQPSTWSQALVARDGPTASVTIYRSMDEAVRGSMISKPSTCQAFADQVAEPGQEFQYGVQSDASLMVPGEKEKEILVVARRGTGVDYKENGTSPMMRNDIRKDWPSMTWGQMRYMGIGWFEDWLLRDYEDGSDSDYTTMAVTITKLAELLPLVAKVVMNRLH